MNPAETSRMQLLARAGLALAACLLLLPTPGHAVTLNVTDDAFISLSNTGKNFGSRFSVKVDGLTGREGFAKFDLSVLGGATASDIDAANLRLWITKVKVAGSIEIRRVLGAWTEDDLTGDTVLLDFSIFPDPLIAPILSSDKGSFVLVDVTALVKDWVGGVSPNDGITLLPVGGTRIQIDSKEGKKTSRPMEIEVILGASSSIIGGGSNSIIGLTGSGATEYVPMFYGDVSVTEALVQQVIPVAGTLKNFHVSIDTAPGAVDSWTFTVRLDPAPGGAPGPTAVTCTINDPATTCSDTVTPAVAFAAGDLISIEAVPSGAAAATPMRWTAEFTP